MKYIICQDIIETRNTCFLTRSEPEVEQEYNISELVKFAHNIYYARH